MILTLKADIYRIRMQRERPTMKMVTSKPATLGASKANITSFLAVVPSIVSDTGGGAYSPRLI
jgi:hypothetical protein